LKDNNNGSGNFIARIPKSYILKLGKLLGICLYFLYIPNRRLVRRNLRFCYPEWSAADIRKMSRRIFKHTGITILEIFQAAYMSPQDIMAGFRFAAGEEHMINALKDKSKGLICAACHIGNWEVGLLYLGCLSARVSGRQLTAVARKIGYEWLDEWFDKYRKRLGNKVIYKKGAWPKMVQTLRRQETLLITLDQSRYKQAVDVTFFSHTATTTPAVAMAAIRCRCPVLPMFCVREADGMQAIHVYPPVEMQRTGDLRHDLQVNTQKMVDAMEDMIRKYPDHWVWFQRPWKKAHPELYPEWEARRQNRKKEKQRRKLEVAEKAS
jgi:KDO2-lipid IV(A) lauroyltransferase